MAIMRHLSSISYNSKAVVTSQLKFSVHKQLLIDAGCGYFNFFTSSSIFLAERISYAMFKFYYETGVSIMRHHIIIFTVNDPFYKETFL